MTLLRVTRAGSLPLSANGRAFLFCCLECPCIPDGRAGKGKARPAAWRGRDIRVEGVNLGGNRAPARGRNRNSRLEPTPQAALAGFLGPDRMAGGSIGLGNCQGWGERASARRSPALSIAQSETGTLPGSQLCFCSIRVTLSVRCAGRSELSPRLRQCRLSVIELQISLVQSKGLDCGKTAISSLNILYENF